jgi:hypothetical protein
MKKLFLLLALAGCVVLSGCASDKGSREYKPGKGWVPS